MADKDDKPMSGEDIKRFYEKMLDDLSLEDELLATFKMLSGGCDKALAVRRRRPAPFGPIGIPAEAFDEIEPTTREDGRVLRRYCFKGWPEGPVLTEVPMDEPPPKHEVTELKPLEAPKGSIFFQEYVYGASEGAELEAALEVGAARIKEDGGGSHDGD